MKEYFVITSVLNGYVKSFKKDDSIGSYYDIDFTDDFKKAKKFKSQRSAWRAVDEIFCIGEQYIQIIDVDFVKE